MKNIKTGKSPANPSVDKQGESPARLFSRKYWNKPERVAYLFMLPSILVLFVFAIIPLIACLVISLFDMNIFFTDTSFAGVHNFTMACQDTRFWNALLNTVVFVLFEVPLQILIGLLTANALVRTSLFNKAARSIFFLPVVCSMAAVGIIWSILLDTNIGFIPYVLEQIGIHMKVVDSNKREATTKITLTRKG